MKSTCQRYHFHIGQRNIKTAVAATLCALIYLIIDRNPTFACIGAVFGLGSDMPDSRLNGGNRFFGTIIGGLIGMGLFRIYICFYPDGGFRALLMLFVFVGVVMLIVLCQLLRWPGGVQPGSVVLSIILFNTPVETYVSYSVNRMIDTGVGVLVALAINVVFTRERVTKWLTALHLKKAAVEITADVPQNICEECAQSARGEE